MTAQRFISAASVACFTLTLSGSAFAADVTYDTTGANSNQQVVVNNSSDYAALNVNNTVVTNTNAQEATTGTVTADKNTTVGGVTSGDASNNNGTSTVVGEANTGTGVVAPQTGAVGGQGVSAGTTPAATGSVLGAATTAGGLGAGVAMLPVTGPSVPVDVSALRAAWDNAQVTAPSATLANTSHMFTGAMLVTATLLSLLAALGSAWYARKREERV